MEQINKGKEIEVTEAPEAPEAPELTEETEVLDPNTLDNEVLDNGEDQVQVEIDWRQEEGLINSYRLNDSEVREALELLEEARRWTVLNMAEVTQRIRLVGKDGSVLHVIRNPKGKPDTKDIKQVVKDSGSVISLFLTTSKFAIKFAKAILLYQIKFELMIYKLFELASTFLKGYMI
jgi:hypothetical protein